MSTSSDSAAGRQGTAVLEKALGLLRLIGYSEHELQFSALLAASGMPKTTLTRTLRFLREQGLVRVDSAGGYHLGQEFISLAHKALGDLDIRAAAMEEMERLRELTSETVHLSVLSGNHVIFVAKLESRQPIRMYSSVGRVCPIHCTGSGKAILAFVEPAQRERILSEVELKRYTPTTITSRRKLDAELARTRENGYSIDDEEHEPEIRCTAAPIFDHSGTVVGALSVTSPAYRCPVEQLHVFAKAVKPAAARVSSKLGFTEAARRA
ncbi:MAG TPA: IclR family transcriptional regulator [Albitalea sp.]|nr:IclR family transcriptional regulator [Albitalea sp.]